MKCIPKVNINFIVVQNNNRVANVKEAVGSSAQTTQSVHLPCQSVSSYRVHYIVRIFSLTIKYSLAPIMGLFTISPSTCSIMC